MFSIFTTQLHIRSHAHTHTHKGVMQLLPLHTVTSRDLYVLKQSGMVIFVVSPPKDSVFICPVLVHCICSCGPVFGPWAIMQQGI